MTDKTNFSDKAKAYYKGKSMWRRYSVLVILLFLVGIQLIGKVPAPEGGATGGVQIAYNEINFAGQPVPFGDEYFFNQEKLDREIAITQLNTAQFVMIHKREPQFFPYIEEQLQKAGIPEDFKYLAVAESALRNVAYSSAGAAGIWQFIPSTAERYGLIVNDDVDERLHFEKATDAAIAYFKDLYVRFGDWNLVAAAYNRGENGLQRDMNRQHMSGYYDLWLNEETSRYVFRILAIKELMQNKSLYFDMSILGAQYDLPKTKTIKEAQIDDIAFWAYEEGYTYAQIRLLNQWIVGNTLPEAEEKWEIKVFK